MHTVTDIVNVGQALTCFIREATLASWLCAAPMAASSLLSAAFSTDCSSSFSPAAAFQPLLLWCGRRSLHTGMHSYLHYTVDNPAELANQTRKGTSSALLTGLEQEMLIAGQAETAHMLLPPDPAGGSPDLAGRHHASSRPPSHWTAPAWCTCAAPASTVKGEDQCSMTVVSSKSLLANHTCL